LDLDFNGIFVLPQSEIERLKLTIKGVVQGVGFRPFIYCLASELNLSGWVNNSAQGVFVEVQGPKARLREFLDRLQTEKPPLSQIHELEVTSIAAIAETRFEIRPSISGEKTALILPDLATCPQCWREIFDPDNRRYRYPFTNCTHCGPRYTIVRRLPYDRRNTTMSAFPMCAECRAEYENPRDRRFHAQPNACPRCGPHLEWWDETGRVSARHDDALIAAARAIDAGQIVAVKGLGGFHLIADARDETAVRRLRDRKQRPDKPFAVMYPSLDAIAADCQVSPEEREWLRSPQGPIVLLTKKPGFEGSGAIAPSVAPRNPTLGVMLPYTPLHHLLLAELGYPVVATSGNRSDEPICTDAEEARDRLRGIADCFLVHNRAIARAVDDSIVRAIGGRATILRRARGYAPLPIATGLVGDVPLGDSSPRLLAVGGHLKNTIAIGRGPQIFVSQHLGDLETPQAVAGFEEAIARLQDLYDFTPESAVCDAHPDYRSTQFVRGLNLPRHAVQHHYAHVLACMADNQVLYESGLGVAWDGTGYGSDGTIWGGEFLRIPAIAEGEDLPEFTRVAYFRPFPLPGGDRAVKEPRRVALGMLYEAVGDRLFAASEDFSPAIARLLGSFTPQERQVLHRMLGRSLNTPKTSSVGRLFDGVAALLGLADRCSFEAQAAIALEAVIDPEAIGEDSYPLPWQWSDDGATVALDWTPTIAEIADDLADGVAVGVISCKFHHTLVEAIVATARRVGESSVFLSGGCFQNRYLSERAIARLRQAGFTPYWHRQIPPNDGGIALGQIVARLRAIATGRPSDYR